MEGIVNGMDTTDWSPNVDKFLDVKYDADTVDEGKALAKEALQAELGLPVSLLRVSLVTCQVSGHIPPATLKPIISCPTCCIVQCWLMLLAVSLRNPNGSYMRLMAPHRDSA